MILFHAEWRKEAAPSAAAASHAARPAPTPALQKKYTPENEKAWCGISGAEKSDAIAVGGIPPVRISPPSAVENVADRIIIIERSSINSRHRKCRTTRLLP